MKSYKLDFRLYLITDRKQISKTLNSKLLTLNLLNAVKQALKGGVKAVQLREKDLNTRELLKLAYRMRDLTKKYKAKLFINDRLDIALAVCADGVHLTQNSIPANAVRKAVKKNLLIGVSTHSLKEAKQAENAGAQFITLGPIYRTLSKLKYGSPVGISTLKQVKKRVKIPVFAIGGIKNNKIKDVKKAGAYEVAMISGIFKADDIKGKAKEIVNLLEDR